MKAKTVNVPRETNTNEKIMDALEFIDDYHKEWKSARSEEYKKILRHKIEEKFKYLTILYNVKVKETYL